MSSASPSATLARVAPVAGSGVANVFPDAASAHCPLMNSWRGAAVNSSTLLSTVTVMTCLISLDFGSHHDTTEPVLAQDHGCYLGKRAHSRIFGPCRPARPDRPGREPISPSRLSCCHADRPGPCRRNPDHHPGGPPPPGPRPRRRQPAAAGLHRRGRAGPHRGQPEQPPLDHRPRPGRQGRPGRAVRPGARLLDGADRGPAGRQRAPEREGHGVGRLPGRAPGRGPGPGRGHHHGPPRRQRPARPVRLGHPGRLELLPGPARPRPGLLVGHRHLQRRGPGHGAARHPGRPHPDRHAPGGVDQGHRLPPGPAAAGPLHHLLRRLRPHLRDRPAAG